MTNNRTKNNMKRAFCGLLVLLLLIMSVPMVSAASTLCGGSCGNKGTNVKWELKDNGDLIISGQGAMKDYPEELTPPWFSEIQKMVYDAIGYSSQEKMARALVNGAIELEDVSGAFAEAAALMNGRIIVKSGVTAVGNYAFTDWPATEIQLPTSLKRIGEWAFSGCQVESLKIPEGVETIEELAFSGTSLKSIDFPESLKTLGWNVCGDDRLEKIVLRGNPTVDSEAITILCHKKNQAIPFANAAAFHKFERVIEYAEDLGFIYITLAEKYEATVNNYIKKNRYSADYAEAMATLDFIDRLLDYNTKYRTSCLDFDEMVTWLLDRISKELNVHIGSVDTIVKEGAVVYPNDGGYFIPAEFTEDFKYLLENYFDYSYNTLCNFGQESMSLGEKSSTYVAMPWIEVSGYRGKTAETLARGSGAVFHDITPSQPGTTDPGTQPDSGGSENRGCPWCGGTHEGFFQGIIGFFHRIFAGLFGAKY